MTSSSYRVANGLKPPLENMPNQVLKSFSNFSRFRFDESKCVKINVFSMLSE